MIAWAAMLPSKSGAWEGIEALQAMVKGTDKPIVGFGRMNYQMTPEALVAQEAAGFPFTQGLEPTLRALNALWFFAQRQGKNPPTLPPPPPSDLSPANLDATLARYGIALPRSKTVATAAEAAVAAESIGFPVALKIVSPDILHKTEAGGVILGLTNAKDVATGAEQLVASAKAAQASARINGFLVQEMVSGVEAIVGARNDPLYGPILLVGAGGVLVELAHDAALRLLPVASGEVSRMIDGLKLKTLLTGFRGKPVADRMALEKTVLALAHFYADHRARVEDVEINPLMVRTNGAVAVDVRVIWKT
jgi:acyl-CoA synthetase (NDP forming)